MKRMEEHFNLEAEKHDSYFLDELGMKEFYDEIESQLNKNQYKKILVLGCGSGLEVERIKYKASVTAVDISENMLEKLKEKKLHPKVTLNTICGSFLDLDFSEAAYDLVLSCYAMHHFNEEQKIDLYKKINRSLKSGGIFLNGDSMSKDKEEEKKKFEHALKVYESENIPFGSLHIDVHFTYNHELQVLKQSGFNKVLLEREWSKTKLYRACK